MNEKEKRRQKLEFSLWIHILSYFHVRTQWMRWYEIWNTILWLNWCKVVAFIANIPPWFFVIYVCYITVSTQNHFVVAIYVISIPTRSEKLQNEFLECIRNGFVFYNVEPFFIRRAILTNLYIVHVFANGIHKLFDLIAVTFDLFYCIGIGCTIPFIQQAANYYHSELE